MLGAEDVSLGVRIKRTHRLFGRRLLALTPRRIDWLRAYGLEGVLDTGSVDRILLRQLALVLSIGDGTRLYRRMHPRHPATLAWRARTWRYDTRREAGKLDAYLVDHLQMPELWRQEEAGRALTGPWMLAQCERYVLATGCHPDVPWEMAIDVLAWELATLGELEGGPQRFMTAEDRALRARLQEQPETDAAAVAAFEAWRAGRGRAAGARGDSGRMA